MKINKIALATRCALDVLSTFKFKKYSAGISSAVILGALVSVPAVAQQTGGISGQVNLIGIDPSTVTVTASSSVMPKPRSSGLSSTGKFTLPGLIPGYYTVLVESSDGASRQLNVEVLLDQSVDLMIDLSSSMSADTEVITISGSQIVRSGDSSLSNSIGEDVIKGLPVGQDYRDLLKIIPGVEVTENGTLGPSAGGSGRDNSYAFDGVNITLPLFGNLSSEPSTHDIANVSIDRGGAKAIGFNRAGGFSINSTSKSGTNEFHGNLEYRIQPSSFQADRDIETASEFDEERTWMTGSLSGPLIEDTLFFYGSYYRPVVTRDSRSTAYGETKEYKSTRDEYFGKFTFAPTEDLLLNLSYRTSEREVEGASVGGFSADSTSNGSTSTQDIMTFDGSYFLGDATTITFSYATYDYETAGRPDTLFPDVQPQFGASLDLANLDQLGLLVVPNIRDNVDGYDNAGAQALIDQFGYIVDGERFGGGQVGGGSTINIQNFYRDAFELNIDHEMELGNTYHTLHFGFQWQEGKELLARTSNGWGSISYVGGLQPDGDYDGDTPVYYQTITQATSFVAADGSTPPIDSRMETYNIEINDTIEHGDFTYNIGVLLSQDTLFGQGLRENPDNVSGYELAEGNMYEMHKTSFSDMIQPRLGVTWEYEEGATVFANFASYNPDTSSLARAASWARNSQNTLNVYFDQNGDYLANEARPGSSGKFFQEGIKPRRLDEYTIGTTKNLDNGIALRGHIRHRKTLHPWEDTWNGSRGYVYDGPFGGVPEEIAAKGLYIPELDAYRAEVGGSSYVIAELDGAVNKYWEASFEGEYYGDNYYINASYVWSHYYGNYDQDITSSASDANLFVGSSNLADGIGRQLWDGKYGKLNGDRPHKLKVFGYYTTSWNANIGGNFFYQSGDVWEAWDGGLYGYSSDTIRYAEHAGSRREASHWQLDLNYRQDWVINEDITLEFAADIFNVFDKQTGYNYNPIADSASFGEPRSLIRPRRMQLSFNFVF
ncbi:carboxypeptidase regulatory-like domain-containing protein [Glaciecola sp. 1036]|uniref:TonB-dependent receptor n=1 Tax=Alteromonadaceae TaxID=72275 RepID=UPI003CFFD828